MKNLPKTALATAIFSLSPLVMAHPKHMLASSTSLMDAVTAGLMHPISGLDHIVLAVGMGLLFASHKKLGLGVLLTGLAFGFMAGLTFTLNSGVVEAAILLSVVITALAVLAQRTRFANAHQSGFFALTAVSLLGLTLFHGMAHALEMPVGSVTVGFASGVAVAMTALFGIGASMMAWVAKQTTERPTTQFTQWLAWLPAVLSSLGAMLVLFNA